MIEEIENEILYEFKNALDKMFERGGTKWKYFENFVKALNKHMNFLFNEMIEKFSNPRTRVFRIFVILSNTNFILIRIFKNGEIETLIFKHRYLKAVKVWRISADYEIDLNEVL